MSGFKLSLAGAKNKPGFKQAGLAAPPAKRVRLALGDDEPEDTIKSVEISGFDTASGGALDASGKAKEVEAPRVIPALPNRNWRDDARRKKAPHAQQQSGQNGEARKENNMAFGLNVIHKEDQIEQDGNADTDITPMDIDDGLTAEQRLEKRALDALLNGHDSGDQTVIPLQSEEQALQHDVQDAPDAPSLDAYISTPIEGFGAALLRGMGWKDGEEIGRNKGVVMKPREVKRRPALLGIGAKEEAAVGIELGAWGGAKKGKWKKGEKEEKGYVPVVMRNKVTGEQISEEELKVKLEQQDFVPAAAERRKERGGEESYDSEAEERRRKRKDRGRRERSRSGSYDSNDYARKRSYKEKDKRDRSSDNYDYDKKSSRRDRSRDRSDRRRDRSPDESYRKRDKRRERSRSPTDSDRRSRKRDYDDERYERKGRRNRSRSRESGDGRKRRRDEEGRGERDGRKKRYKEDKGDRY
jgi:hypothetical protein